MKLGKSDGEEGLNSNLLMPTWKVWNQMFSN